MIKKSSNKNHGLALLETAILTVVLVPILATIVGLLDLAYTQLAIKHLASEALSDIDIKTLRLRTGIKGSYLYGRTLELDQLTQALNNQLTDKVTASFGLNPLTDANKYRVATAFSLFSINEQTGAFIHTSNWGDHTSPNGYTHHPAFRQRVAGNVPATDTTNFRRIFCYPPTGPKGATWPNIATYPKLCPQNDPLEVLANVPFILDPIPSGHLGTLQQVYYGGSHIYDNGSMKSDYLRQTAALGISISVDIGSRPGGKVLSTIQAGPAIIRAAKVTAPRSFL